MRGRLETISSKIIEFMYGEFKTWRRAVESFIEECCFSFNKGGIAFSNDVIYIKS